MKKTKVGVTADSAEGFFKRIRSRAAKLDKGETLPSEITISFEDPAEMLKVLTAERVRLLQRVKRQSLAMSALATGLKRDVRAVSRDVSLLEKAGLLHTSLLPNPGHGLLKVVEPVAREYKLVANL
ncbi:MAG: MarR family transcriptional regulator [Acidobacteriota bacterium]|nr:MarR family transcriptional regulator [Acidobacteriota bacterium]